VLDAARAELQGAWDVRARDLRAREAALFQLYADVGAGIEAGFSAVGDRVSAARVAAYEAEAARVRKVKDARRAAIAALAADIAGLWEELGFAARDETEAAIARGELDALGWGEPVVERLQQKAAALLAEKAAREERIMVMGQAITALWKRLATPEDEQTAFLEAHAGIGDDVIAAVRAPRGRGRRRRPRKRALTPPLPPLPPVRKVPRDQAGRVRRAPRRADCDGARDDRGAVARDAAGRGRARGRLPRLFRARGRL